MRLSLAFSPCPNDTFIFDALVNDRLSHDFKLDVRLADIDELNKMYLSNEADVIKVSYHALAYNLENYQILDCGSALGRGVGPLLIANRNTVKITQETTVAIPGELTTANFLLKYAYPALTNKIPMIFSSIENAVLAGQVDLGLIIHENRFTYSDKGLYKIMDLGKFWEDQTALPIPLGAIAIRRSLSEETKIAFQDILRKSIFYAFDNPESSKDYIRQHAQDMNPVITQKHIDLYVNDFSKSLGEIGRKTVIKLLNAVNPSISYNSIFLD